MDESEKRALKTWGGLAAIMLFPVLFIVDFKTWLFLAAGLFCLMVFAEFLVPTK